MSIFHIFFQNLKKEVKSALDSLISGSKMKEIKDNSNSSATESNKSNVTSQCSKILKKCFNNQRVKNGRHFLRFIRKIKELEFQNHFCRTLPYFYTYLNTHSLHSKIVDIEPFSTLVKNNI